MKRRKYKFPPQAIYNWKLPTKNKTMSETNEPVAVAAEPPATPAPVRPPPIEITLEKAKQFRPYFNRKMCYIVNYADGLRRYFADGSIGDAYSEDISKAMRYSVWDALSYLNPIRLYGHCRLELIDQDLAATILKKRSCINDHVSETIVELLRVAPTNPTARALVLRDTGKMPPDGLATFQEVADWIEENVGPEPEAVGTAIPVPIPAPPAAPVVAFPVRLDFSEEEFGRCSYRQVMSGSGVYNVTSEDIDNILRTHPDQSVSQLSDQLESMIWDNADERVGPRMVAAGEATHDDHESEDTLNRSIDIRGGRAGLINLLSDYLRARLTPEQLRERGL